MWTHERERFHPMGGGCGLLPPPPPPPPNAAYAGQAGEVCSRHWKCLSQAAAAACTSLRVCGAPALPDLLHAHPERKVLSRREQRAGHRISNQPESLPWTLQASSTPVCPASWATACARQGSYQGDELANTITSTTNNTSSLRALAANCVQRSSPASCRTCIVWLPSWLPNVTCPATTVALRWACSTWQ